MRETQEELRKRLADVPKRQIKFRYVILSRHYIYCLEKNEYICGESLSLAAFSSAELQIVKGRIDPAVHCSIQYIFPQCHVDSENPENNYFCCMEASVLWGLCACCWTLIHSAQRPYFKTCCTIIVSHIVHLKLMLRWNELRNQFAVNQQKVAHVMILRISEGSSCISGRSVSVIYLCDSININSFWLILNRYWIEFGPEELILNWTMRFLTIGSFSRCSTFRGITKQCMHQKFSLAIPVMTDGDSNTQRNPCCWCQQMQGRRQCWKQTSTP